MEVKQDLVKQNHTFWLALEMIQNVSKELTYNRSLVIQRALSALPITKSEPVIPGGGNVHDILRSVLPSQMVLCVLHQGLGPVLLFVSRPEPDNAHIVLAFAQIGHVYLSAAAALADLDGRFSVHSY